MLTKEKNFQIFTLMGTAHYMAPEVFIGKGYSYNADLWSVGVCLYEFLCGGIPYGENLEVNINIILRIKRTLMKSTKTS